MATHHPSVSLFENFNCKYIMTAQRLGETMSHQTVVEVKFIELFIGQRSFLRLTYFFFFFVPIIMGERLLSRHTTCSMTSKVL